MSKQSMKTRLQAIGGVLGTIAWRGFGLFLFIMGGAAGTGAIVAGSWVDGVIIAWATLMLGVVGAVGYAIATTGSASSETVVKSAVWHLGRSIP
jgi:hypothetical protein